VRGQGSPTTGSFNLVEHMLEVRRDPVAAPCARYGHGYGVTITLGAGDQLSPLSAPTAAILVPDLRP
jgi:hypothetical protein